MESEDSDYDHVPSHVYTTVAVQTTGDICSHTQLQDEIIKLRQNLVSSTFRLLHIAQDDQKILYYTGFPN